MVLWDFLRWMTLYTRLVTLRARGPNTAVQLMLGGRLVYAGARLKPPAFGRGGDGQSGPSSTAR